MLKFVYDIDSSGQTKKLISTLELYFIVISSLELQNTTIEHL